LTQFRERHQGEHYFDKIYVGYTSTLVGNVSFTGSLTVGTNLAVTGTVTVTGTATFSSTIEHGDTSYVVPTSASTTSSAAVTAFTVSVSENSAVGITATAVGRESGGSGEHYYGKVAGLFKRETAGNVTEVGSDQALFTAINDGNWVGLALAADTGTQTIDVNVASSASTTARWRVSAEYTVVSTA